MLDGWTIRNEDGVGTLRRGVCSRDAGRTTGIVDFPLIGRENTEERRGIFVGEPVVKRTELYYTKLVGSAKGRDGPIVADDVVAESELLIEVLIMHLGNVGRSGNSTYVKS